MGQGLSCGTSDEHVLFTAVQCGDLETEGCAGEEPESVKVVSMLIDKSVNPDLLNRYKQTPLMLAAMHGKISRVQKLIEAGANILVFDSLNGRTCLHYAAYYGHSDCLKTILSAARTSHVASSWGYVQFVNVKDGKGATPLHLATRQRRPECVHILLDNGALVCVLQLVDTVSQVVHHFIWLQELVFLIAFEQTNSDNGMDDNVSEVSDTEVCCICFDQLCTIQVQHCRHQMCAHCILALCCHNKPNPPVCPFCRSSIVQLDVIELEKEDGTEP
ncbi:hypothetical protein K7X08_004381 [Anisodus acutangulus]|uniref:RING-type E3 ubiquitin transferase n=1 Tax=Anisodus acutangulus TaxID=402998 RepID=A0A9Q1RHD9_9SOLA|nr:hypothetical protein K7X08_004381 [Anisodus acutangulus]